jgi:hypothetical protein
MLFVIFLWQGGIGSHFLLCTWQLISVILGCDGETKIILMVSPPILLDRLIYTRCHGCLRRPIIYMSATFKKETSHLPLHDKQKTYFTIPKSPTSESSSESTCEYTSVSKSSSFMFPSSLSHATINFPSPQIPQEHNGTLRYCGMKSKRTIKPPAPILLPSSVCSFSGKPPFFLCNLSALSDCASSSAPVILHSRLSVIEK